MTDLVRDARSRRVAPVRRQVVVAIVLVYLCAAWWPFDVVVPHRVSNDARPVGDGFAFGHGVLVSRGPAPFLAGAIERQAISLSLEVRSAVARQWKASILAIAADDENADLVVAQEGADLVVRVRRPWSTASGAAGFVVPGAIPGTEWHRLRVTLAAGVLAVGVDDRPVREWQVGRAAFEAWSAGYPVSLGNAPNGATTWKGEIRDARVVVAGATTDLVEPGVLDRPAQWWVLPWRGRSLAGNPNALDVVLNVIGFVPLGVAVALGRRSGVGWSLAAGFAVSVAMEAGQLAMPSRDPSVVDLATNVAGAVGGGVLVRQLVPVRGAANRR